MILKIIYKAIKKNRKKETKLFEKYQKLHIFRYIKIGIKSLLISSYNLKSIKMKSNKKTKKGEVDKESLKKKIKEIFESNKTQTFNYKQISASLGITKKEERTYVLNVLRILVEESFTKEVSREKYVYNLGVELIEGIIDINKSKNAYLTNTVLNEDIFISFFNLKSAMHGDKVSVRIVSKKGKSRVEGEVVEIKERAKKEFVGKINLYNGNGFFTANNPKMIYDIFVPKEKLNNAKDKDKVIVEILRWNKRDKSPVGFVKEVLGASGNNNVEMHAILAEFGLPSSFPDFIENEANNIPSVMTEEENAKRKDFRDVTTFTIDPADAKDFDDAISFEFLENGNYRIGIHIADVSHFLVKGTELDKEAYNRATSVYLVDRVVPMLPEILSNGLCSLRPGEEKYCFSVIVELDNNAKVINYDIDKTIIKSDKRFSYEEAQEIIEKKRGCLSEELLKLNFLAKKIRTERFRKGAFNFEHFEVKFILDENACPINVYFKETKDSNILIEEFMLLANRIVAEHIGKQKKPFVYRIHAEPNEQKLEVFSNFIKKYGHKIDTSSRIKLAKSMNSLISSVNGSAESNMIESLAIRAMAKAVYSTDNIGHYGLAFDYYTHFTSPIRRYPDVMVHRLLYSYLKNQKINSDNLKEDCKHCSYMELQATQAERASIKYKQVEFMKNKLGVVFKAIITGVTEFGLFAEISENACEGLIHISSIKDDNYFFEGENYRLVGKHNNKTYQLGDEISVRVVQVNLERKQIDLELA